MRQSALLKGNARVSCENLSEGAGLGIVKLPEKHADNAESNEAHQGYQNEGAYLLKEFPHVYLPRDYIYDNNFGAFSQD